MMKNVLLLGESICISYREKVKELLRGRSRMEKVRIGILGCGNVSREYVEAAQPPGRVCEAVRQPALPTVERMCMNSSPVMVSFSLRNLASACSSVMCVLRSAQACL